MTFYTAKYELYTVREIYSLRAIVGSNILIAKLTFKSV